MVNFLFVLSIMFSSKNQRREAFHPQGFTASPSFSFMLHFADFEGEEPSSLISQDYQDCFLSFPLHRIAFIALKDMKRERETLLSAFEPEKVRKLLFFDLECANSDEGIGKICEFGSVTTDLSFNVVSECE